MSIQTEKDLFQAAYNLIKDPKKWTQRSLARDADGKPTAFRSPTAVSWCSSGVVMKCNTGYLRDLGYNVRDLGYNVRCALRKTIGGSLVDFNDTHTHAEVMAMWEETGKREGWL